MTYARKLGRLQRVLARRVKGSNRRALTKRKVARQHSRIASVRKDCLDKLTTDLVRRFDVIALEDLNVRGMVKNHCLAKHVSDASFGQFRRMIEYKAGWHGKEIRIADRFFPSSKRCSGCGFVHASMPLDVRAFTCVQCGAKHDRDENAAKNILNFAEVIPQATAGQAGSNGRGERVKPRAASAVKGNARRSVNRPSSMDVEHVLHS
jgi:putative transposase